MNDVTQIRIGRHMTGIVGLRAALDEAASTCRGMPDEKVAEVLLEILSRCNYIESRIKDVYAQAFVREYRRHVGGPAAEEPVSGLQIKVLGMGCPQCDRLEQEVMAALAETGSAGELEHVRDIARIAALGVMGTPALIVNGVVKAVGSVPRREKIKAWIVEAVRK